MEIKANLSGKVVPNLRLNPDVLYVGTCVNSSISECFMILDDQIYFFGHAKMSPVGYRDLEQDKRWVLDNYENIRELEDGESVVLTNPSKKV